MINIIKRTLEGKKIKSEPKLNSTNEFWNYCEINIPISIEYVPSIDQVNTIYKDGSETELFGNVKRLSIKEYQNKYAFADSTGKLFWKNN